MDLEFETENSKKVIFWTDASYFRRDCQVTPKKYRRRTSEVNPRSNRIFKEGKVFENSNKKKCVTLAEKIFDEFSANLENVENSAVRRKYVNNREQHSREEELEYKILDKKRVFTEELAKLAEKHFGKQGFSKVSSTYESWTYYEPSEGNAPILPAQKIPDSSASSTPGRQLVNWRSNHGKSPTKVSFSREPVNTHRDLKSSNKSFKLDHSKSSSQMHSELQSKQTRKPPIKAILDMLEIEYPENNTQSASSNQQLQSDMVCIQVSAKDQFCEDVLVHLEELTRLKLDFPRLTKLIPDPNGAINVEYRAEIVSELLRYMCGNSNNWTELIPDWRTAVEMLSLTKMCKLKHLQKSIAAYFDKSLISEDNAEDIFKLSHHFQVPEVLTLCKEFLRELGYSFTELENDALELKKVRKTCTVSTFFHLEPDAFIFPLQKIEQYMAGAFHKDIQNEIKFESIDGHFEITGVQLNLQPTDAKITLLDIYCDLSNESENIKWEEYREMKLDPVMVIKFRKKLLVKTGQTAVINVAIDNLKPRVCSSMREKQYKEKSSCGTFLVTPTSNLRASDDYKIFFLEKMFYIGKK